MMPRSTTFFLFASIPSLAAAEVVHVRFDPPSEVPADGVATPYDLNQDGVHDIEFFNVPGVATRFRMLNGTAVVAASSDFGPRSFPYGELIGPGLYWSSSSIVGYFYLDGDDGKNIWGWNDSGAYMGLRFAGPDGTQYGWLRLRSGLDSAELTLLRFAYETDPDVAIPAGAVPAPAGLAALAIGALARNRRR